MSGLLIKHVKYNLEYNGSVSAGKKLFDNEHRIILRTIIIFRKVIVQQFSLILHEDHPNELYQNMKSIKPRCLKFQVFEFWCEDILT